MEDQVESKFYLYLSGKYKPGYPPMLTLGPWAGRQAAEDYATHLTTSRIGEQILTQLGIEKLVVQES
jgi:hypothetical protein